MTDHYVGYSGVLVRLSRLASEQSEIDKRLSCARLTIFSLRIVAP